MDLTCVDVTRERLNKVLMNLGWWLCHILSPNIVDTEASGSKALPGTIVSIFATLRLPSRSFSQEAPHSCTNLRVENESTIHSIVESMNFDCYLTTIHISRRIWLNWTLGLFKWLNLIPIRIHTDPFLVPWLDGAVVTVRVTFRNVPD
jgi:hypothetical protein